MLTLSTIDPARFRSAMSRFPAAVCLVTTDGPAGRRGLTVSSVAPVSDDPATLLVCLNTASAANEKFVKNGNFAVSVLGVETEAVARGFAGEGKLEPDARFALGAWSALETGAPLLDGALIGFDCRLTGSSTVATHRILIGTVAAIRMGPASPSLVYLDRQYRSL